MKNILIYLFLLGNAFSASAQRGFNYYKDSSRVGSPNKKAYEYFKKAYYDHIWKWTEQGADSAEYYLKMAIAEAPDYSAAYAFLAHVYQFKTYTNRERDKMFALEKQNAEKALSFQPKTGDGYSVMADVKWEEKDTISALPSEMYIRDMRLSSTYRALNECYQAQARKRLGQFIELNKRRIANEPDDANFLLGILEGEYMPVEQDSVQKKCSSKC